MSFNETYHDRADIIVHDTFSIFPVKAFREVRTQPKQECEICFRVSSYSFIDAHNANVIMQTVIYFYMQTLETNILGHCFQRVFDG